MQACFIEVEAGVRYWEDAYLNGVEDSAGKIPLRQGNIWKPIIDLKTGLLLDWPNDVEAKIHYKVCDAGQYWLLDENKRRIAKWKGYYVPNNILCIKDNGYGDYIIFNVERSGFIQHWKDPYIDWDKWQELDKESE